MTEKKGERQCALQLRIVGKSHLTNKRQAIKLVHKFNNHVKL